MCTFSCTVHAHGHVDCSEHFNKLGRPNFTFGEGLMKIWVHLATLWGFEKTWWTDRQTEKWSNTQIFWKFDQDQTWFSREKISWGLGGCLWFLIGDLKDGVIFDIIDHIDSWYGRYPEIFIKIWHDLAVKEKVGLGGCWWFLTGDLEDWGHLLHHKSCW